MSSKAPSEVVFDIDLAIRRGPREIAVAFATDARIVALFGPSGAGKTTVLDAVAGLVKPVSGHARIAGVELGSLPPERRACGYVFQDRRLFPHRTVRQNLLYGERLAPPERRFLTLAEATAFLGIERLLDRMPAGLSGGEAQRVAIGRALLSGPRCLLLDEPLSALDRARREDILAVIARIRDELHLPMLYVSHDRAEVDRLAGHVVAMEHS